MHMAKLYNILIRYCFEVNSTVLEYVEEKFAGRCDFIRLYE